MLRFLTSVVCGLFVLLGARLLNQSLKTRQLPERLVGLCFLVLGPSAAVYLAVQANPNLDDHLRRLGALATCGTSLSGALLFVFTYRTFRHGVGWAKALTVLFVLGIATSVYIEVQGAAFLIDSTPRLSVVLPRFCGLAWSTYEAVRCYAMMRRRQRFGLGDAIVTNRFLLYALWTGAYAALPALKTIVRLLALNGVEMAWRLPFALLSIASGLVMLTAMCLNFYPPRAYLAWLQGRAPEVVS